MYSTQTDEVTGLPQNADAFVALLNDRLGWYDRALSHETDLMALDSLDKLQIWVVLDDLGAELPPGIERHITNVDELFAHASNRWAAEGLTGSRRPR